MSDTLTAAVQIDLTGNLSRGLGVAQERLEGFGRKGERSVSRLSAALGGVDKAAGILANRWTAMMGGFATLQSVTQVAQLERQFGRLGVQAGRSRAEMMGLKDEIFQVSSQAGIAIDPAELTNAINEIVNKTGDLDFARANMANLAQAIQATGATGQQIGAVFTEIMKKFKIEGPEDLAAAFSTLVEQGKAGAFPLDAMASLGERLVASYAAMGRTGPGAVAEMGALIQVFRQGTGSAEQAATAFERVNAELLANATALEGAGIQLFELDKDGKKTGEWRAIPDVLTDIIKAADADPILLQTLFGSESMRGLNAMIGMFDKATGQIKDMDAFLKIRGSQAQLAADAARVAQDAAASAQRFKNAWQMAVDGLLSGPLRRLSESLSKLSPETMSNIVVAAGGVAAAASLWRVGRGLAGSLGKGKGGPGGGLDALRLGPGGAVPVYIVGGGADFGAGAPLGLPPGGGAANGGAGGAARTAGRLGRVGGTLAKLGRFGLKALPFVGTGAAMAMPFLDDEAPMQEKVGRSAATGLFTGGGALLGGILGSVIPGAGTVAGASLGMMLGGMAEAAFGDMTADAIESAVAEHFVRIEIEDRAGVARVSDVQSPGDIFLDFNRGPMLPGVTR